jgi:hypothetical protein
MRTNMMKGGGGAIRSLRVLVCATVQWTAYTKWDAGLGPWPREALLRQPSHHHIIPCCGWLSRPDAPGYAVANKQVCGVLVHIQTAPGECKVLEQPSLTHSPQPVQQILHSTPSRRLPCRSKKGVGLPQVQHTSPKGGSIACKLCAFQAVLVHPCNPMTHHGIVQTVVHASSVLST